MEYGLVVHVFNKFLLSTYSVLALLGMGIQRCLRHSPCPDKTHSDIALHYLDDNMEIQYNRANVVTIPLNYEGWGI